MARGVFFLVCIVLSTCTAGAQSLDSPRLNALRDAVQQGAQGPVESFWQEVSAKGAPLIERAGERPPYVLVTFLWRGNADTKHVFVAGQLGQLTGTRRDDNLMTRLGQTSVWYRSYWLRSDARTLYQIGVNASLVAPDGDVPEEGLQRDPLNPKKWEPPATPGQIVNRLQSVLELPDAPAQSWLVRRPQTPSGQLHETTWKSVVLGNERRVWVYTPPGYQSAGRVYPLVVATDGGAYVYTQQVPVTLDNLIAAGRIPPVIVVFVANAPNVPGKRPTRSAELTCNEAFTEFLSTEIVPWARLTYHATANPAQTVVAGYSYGGLSAACTALRRPDVFGNVLSQSGSFWYRPAGDTEGEWLTREYAAKPTANIRFYMNVGLLEVGTSANAAVDWIDRTDTNIPYGPSMVVVNRHMRDVLRLKGYSVTYAEVVGGHNQINWQGTFGDGLIALLGPKEQSSR